MKGQRNFDMSGTSRLSLADAGLGAAAGFLVPVITEKLITQYAGTNEFLADASNKRMVAAAAGIVVAIPLFYWRGMAPALVAAAIALVYGVGGYIQNWVTGLGAEGAPAQLGRGRSVGLLQQAARQRQLGALQQAGGRRRRSFEFAGTAD
jgi:hypothetical protein